MSLGKEELMKQSREVEDEAKKYEKDCSVWHLSGIFFPMVDGENR